MDCFDEEVKRWEECGYGAVWVRCAYDVAAHLAIVRRRVEILTRSPNESREDKRDRVLASFALGLLELEMIRTFAKVKRKRARKRAAAIRHRANAIYNAFFAKVLARSVREMKAILEGLNNEFTMTTAPQDDGSYKHTYTRIVAPDPQRHLGYWDLREGWPGKPVLFYPNAIIRIDLD